MPKGKETPKIKFVLDNTTGDLSEEQMKQILKDRQTRLSNTNTDNENDDDQSSKDNEETFSPSRRNTRNSSRRSPSKQTESSTTSQTTPTHSTEYEIQNTSTNETETTLQEESITECTNVTETTEQTDKESQNTTTSPSTQTKRKSKRKSKSPVKRSLHSTTQQTIQTETNSQSNTQPTASENEQETESLNIDVSTITIPTPTHSGRKHKRIRRAHGEISKAKRRHRKSKIVPIEQDDYPDCPFGIFTNNTKGKKRLRPGIKALAEIKAYQNRVELQIPKTSFKKLIKQLARKYPITLSNGRKVVAKFQGAALFALHEAAEAFLIKILEDTGLLAIHARRVTIRVEDIRMLIRILDHWGVMRDYRTIAQEQTDVETTDI